MLPQSWEVRIHIRQQCGKGGPLMILGDFPARPAPEPLDPVRVGIIGRRVNDLQVVLPPSQHPPHEGVADLLI